MNGRDFSVEVFDGFESSNVFMVNSGSHTFLIDAGMHGVAEAVVHYIKENALPEPEAVVLTHRHIDHVAGISVIIGAFRGIPIFAEEGAARALNEGDRETTGSALFGIALPTMNVFPLSMRSREPALELPSFLDGFDVFGTPGHTSDSIVFFHRETGSLFSGDTVFANGGVGRWDLPTGSLAELVKSIDFLRTLDVKALYPGHGPAVESGGKFHIEHSYRAIEAYI